jgi:hypothetical protein
MDQPALRRHDRSGRIGTRALLPDRPEGGQVVPDWPTFLAGCLRYRAALDRELAEAPRSDEEFGE